jgi:hypothetical protein
MSGPEREEELVNEFRKMYEELREWREKHPDASFDEIVSQITPRRRELMGALAAELALQQGTGVEVEGLICEKCGEPMKYKGDPERGAIHLEGDTELKRAYYHCPRCEEGIFPPGPETEAGES